ncbi:alpha/beta hydrolase [Candidatus Acetothermia bacterium]|nr:alpha/beta hydrolase [Candidatus Acetothermia bacterium]MBI3642760.1 alpha/beta hydrolase [Candidatus Acetothermia bacterium]
MEGAASRFRYLERGRGEAVVLLHGLFGSPENWNDVIDSLSVEFRVLALQFPIDYQPKRSLYSLCTIPQLTEYVREFLDYAGVERVILAGNSLGGQVAIDFCIKHPERVERLIITGSAGLFERSLSGGGIPKVCREFVREKASEIFYDPKHVTEDLVEEIFEMLGDRNFLRFLLRIAKSTRDYNVKSELDKIKVPTLIVWGKNDQITPPTVAYEFQEHLENAQLVFLDRCGHTPPIERPIQFSEIARDFLEKSLAPIS